MKRLAEKRPQWRQLAHHGPLFPPPYVPLPRRVQLLYDGRPVRLAPAAEEAAGFFARLLEHPDVARPRFRANFFREWRQVMSEKERQLITDLDKCDFSAIAAHYAEEAELRKKMSKEDRKKLRLERENLRETFGYCWVDGRRQRVGNYRVEPPGLFLGRGDHPQAGRLKQRVQPEDVVINVGEDTPKPPAGHRWSEVRHDTSVTWLASWTDSVLGKTKYVQLNPDSRLRSRRDIEKYEAARRLGAHIDKIRQQYQQGWKSKNLLERQTAVALYFIDKLALRVGTEKEPGLAADTVGCCLLRAEHVQLRPPRSVHLDFPGKDGVRYRKDVTVPPAVYNNIAVFRAGKLPGQRLFDLLSASCP
ncbi:TOP1MT [Cordylochernes scorpioides]|uniref:DNA topoisomerase 1 n=1 Tax=Cordylochernes scorpioides TaxID=51811 RepID=A0ABY6L7F7_9ARAC|nr:TOP1MT [Cordylochernes scorpioides]